MLKNVQNIEKREILTYHYYGDIMKLVKACCDLGVHVNGSNLAPDELLEERKIDAIKVEKKNVKKELEKDNKHKNLESVNDFNERLYNEITKIEDKVLTIGGDHSIAIASALASKKKHGNIGIIWIDAHADFHTMETTISGNIHGVPFATVCGQNGNVLSYFFDKEYFNPKNAVLVGGRDIEDAEYVNLDKAGVTVFTTEDIKKYGPVDIMKKAFEIALNNTDGIHISYDVDVIDPNIAPGVSVKAKDGIDEEEAYEIADFLVKEKESIKSIDLVEFNPLEDKNNVTHEITENVLDRLLTL